MDQLHEIRHALLVWYDAHRRDMPWRRTDGRSPDPYHVWTAEVMLQQTRVDTVRGYYARWLGRFPSLRALAAASEDEVMKAWEGLGYYSRARNFHRAVREVVQRYDARVPDDPATFQSLPGVGRYTAGAVQSIAYGHPEPVVDGNVRRVLARWWDEPTPRDAALWARAGALAVGPRPGDLNQALMELGATVCIPRSPRCSHCPVERFCRARAAGTQGDRPARKPARPLPHEDTAVAVVRDARGSVLFVKRPPGTRLAGMWEFPSWIREAHESPADAAERGALQRFGLRVAAETSLGEVGHTFSHVRVTYRVVGCRVAAPDTKPLVSSEGIRWLRPAEHELLALPRAQKRIAALAAAAYAE